MPERATRLGELHQHGIQSAAGRPPDLQRALRLHPDWTVCTTCPYPVDPAATTAGHTTHPGCAQ